MGWASGLLCRLKAIIIWVISFRSQPRVRYTKYREVDSLSPNRRYPAAAAARLLLAADGTRWFRPPKKSLLFLSNQGDLRMPKMEAWGDLETFVDPLKSGWVRILDARSSSPICSFFHYSLRKQQSITNLLNSPELGFPLLSPKKGKWIVFCTIDKWDLISCKVYILIWGGATRPLEENTWRKFMYMYVRAPLLPTPHYLCSTTIKVVYVSND